jgi:hypothetical protein
MITVILIIAVAVVLIGISVYAEKHINKKTIKASIQSIGNSLIVSGLIASLFKDDVSILIMFTLMMFSKSFV